MMHGSVAQRVGRTGRGDGRAVEVRGLLGRGWGGGQMPGRVEVVPSFMNHERT